MRAPDLEAYARDGFLVLPDFLSVADCDALQARAAELVARFDAGPVRTVFSSHDQSHAKARYFRESGGDIRFFFEEEATDQPAALALNKIGHALHDLDPVFERISRQPRISELARALGFVQPLLLQSMYLFKQPHIGGEVGWHQDATYLHTTPATVTGFWIALDDADRDNGCLMALRGAHRGPLRERFHERDNELVLDTRPHALARGRARCTRSATRHLGRAARSVAPCQRAKPVQPATAGLLLAHDRWKCGIFGGQLAATAGSAIARVLSDCQGRTALPSRRFD